ncbi:regulator of (H+)-ATPase in vacuolar membrane [Tilletia horrida]|uniref:Regulator of (H+)-ATPase in vacuolar membrane n=1 Tax=Tilletia horrida TaxID=155126 RepID=A0AAN6GXN6_9BASI|nr:regulator of (H+)-ATPase in vacuolar membrane [Tilletia horrida]
MSKGMDTINSSGTDQQQHGEDGIATAASLDGRRTLIVRRNGSSIHLLDHTLDTGPIIQHDAQLQSIRAACTPAQSSEHFLVAASSTGAIHLWQEPRSSSSLFIAKRNQSQASTNNSSSWRIHSTLHLDSQEPILTFDLAVRKLATPYRPNPNNGKLAPSPQQSQLVLLVGTPSAISLWSYTQTWTEGSSNALPASWKKEWHRTTPAPVACVSLTQTGSLAAAFIERDTRAIVWSITAPPASSTSGFRTPTSRTSAPHSTADSPDPQEDGPEEPAKQSASQSAIKAATPILSLIDRIEHSRPLVSLQWRHPSEGPSARSDPVLLTHTTDGTARIWATVIDQPLQFRLWSSVLAGHVPRRRRVRPSANTESTSQSAANVPERVFYLGAQEATMAFQAHIWALEKDIMRAELGVEDFELPDNDVHSKATHSQQDQRNREQLINQRKTRLQRSQQIVSEMPDLFLTVMHGTDQASGGTIRITAIANIDRSPPTLLQTFTILHDLLRLPSNESIVSARLVPLLTASGIATLLPRQDGANRATAALVLVTQMGTELIYALTPGLLFEGSPEGLKLKKVRRGTGIEEDDDGDRAALPLCHPKPMKLAILWGEFDLARNAIVELDHRIQDTDPEDLVEVHSLASEESHFLTTRTTEKVLAPTTEEAGTESSETGSEQTHELQERISHYAPKRRIEELEESDVQESLRLMETAQRAKRKVKGLDSYGQKFVTALEQASSEALAKSSAVDSDASPKQRRRRGRLCMAGSEVAWAAHSSQQAKVIQRLEEHHGGRLTWSAASSTSLFLWLRGSPETVRQHAESVARAQYTGTDADDEEEETQHDPTRCSMLYYALGKHKLVLSLWRQASWHPDQKKMITFLSNDFTEERWRTAALKNAFALMSKRKFALAGAFFMLGGSLRDATNVCARNMEDVELAVAVARVAEGRDDGPVLRNVVQTKVLPLAIERRDRGLASLGLGLLGESELEMEVLVTPSLQDFGGQNEKMRNLMGQAAPTASTVEEDDGYDLSALLLYNQLQTRLDKPRPSELVEVLARDAVLRHARQLRRERCDMFALRLILDWRFPSPRPPKSSLSSVQSEETAGAINRGNGTTTAEATPSAAARRPPPAVAASDELSSSLWDSFDTTPQATRQAQPAAERNGGSKVEKEPASTSQGPAPGTETSGTQPVKKTGLGTLMKPVSAAQANQGGTDFDMSAFGF